MWQQLMNAMVLGSVFLLFSLGLSLAWGSLDVLNLAHGSIFVFGAFIAYEISLNTSVSALWIGLAAPLGCGIVAALLEILAFGRIRERTTVRRHSEFGVLVASLGGGTIIGHVVDSGTNSQIFSQTVVSPEMHSIGGVAFSNLDVVIIVTSLATAWLLHRVISRSRYGRSIRALAADPTTAGLMGINVNLTAVGTMFISGALAGLAGVLLAFNSSGMTVATGESYMISAFAILVVGGVGSIFGAVIISFGLALAQTAVVAYGPTEFQTAVAFGLILVFLIFRPTGLFAKQLGARV